MKSTDPSKTAVRPPTVSQKDIAHALNLDQSTVSFILSGKRLDRYPEETRRQVFELAEKLNYRPNRAARRLRGDGSKLIAVLEFDTRNSLTRNLLQAICTSITQRGYTPLTIDVNWFTYSAGSACDILIEQGAEGILLVGFGDHFAREELPRLLKSRIPLAVCLGLNPGNLLQFDFDRKAFFYQITQQALSRPNPRPAFLGRPASTLPGLQSTPWDEAIQGYREAMQAAGLKPIIHLETEPTGFPTDFPASGAIGMRRLLARKKPPNAVICFNDLMAIAAMGTALQAGFQIPRDIAFYGFGDEEISTYTHPSLTSLRVDPAAVARPAVDALFDAIQSGQPTPHKQIFVTGSGKLIQRGST